MLTYKEFYIWVDGFMTNRDWTTIRQIDIETLQEKLKEVTDGRSETIMITPFERIPVPVNPLPKNDDPYKPPFEIYCGNENIIK